MNVFIKEHELNDVLLKLITRRNSFEEKLVEVIMKQLENEASMFLFSFKSELDQHNPFKALEDLYIFSEEIKDIYSKCIDIFYKNVNRFQSLEIKEILSGIIWSLENVLTTYPKDSENRIELERIHLVSEAIRQMKSVFKKSIQGYIDYKLSSELLEFDLAHAIEEMIHHIFENEGSSIKEIHAYSLKMMNLLDKRIEGRKYINFVSTAKKNLEVYQTINVEILQRKIEDDSDVETFKNIINVIRELYRKLELKENEMYSIVNYTTFSTNTISESFNRLKNIDHMVQHILNNEELILLVDEFQNHKIQVLEQLTLSILDEINKAITFSMYDISSQSKEVQFLSCNIVESLKQANECLQELKNDISIQGAEEDELIKVLIDTIDLKYLTLKDKDVSFLITKKEQYINYEKRLMDYKADFQEKIKEYFEKMISDSKTYFLNSQVAFEKILNQLIDKNDKEDISYLKTDLLFEIVTLEEIIKFCLPKLKDSQKDNVERVVEVIENCYVQIEKNILLAKIETIEPAIHDRFNGKDHEAILVEDRKGFKKGEIVAVHTKGYKYKGIPVVRANIVAAK